jgi:hypothetical protein
MTVLNNNSSPYEETDADRRRGILDDNALSVDLVSAVAGDRPLTEPRTIVRESIRKRQRGFLHPLLYQLNGGSSDHTVAYQHLS